MDGDLGHCVLQGINSQKVNGTSLNAKSFRTNESSSASHLKSQKPFGGRQRVDSNSKYDSLRQPPPSCVMTQCWTLPDNRRLFPFNRHLRRSSLRSERKLSRKAFRRRRVNRCPLLENVSYLKISSHAALRFFWFVGQNKNAHAKCSVSFATVNNLATFINYFRDWDPETGESGFISRCSTIDFLRLLLK